MSNTIVQTLQRSAREFGDRIALSLRDGDCSFRALEETVHACAIALEEIAGEETFLSVVVRPDVSSVAALLAGGWIGRPVLAVDDPARIDAPADTTVVAAGSSWTARELLECGRALRAQGVAAPARADASILMRTSGTTGASKTAVQPLVNLVIGADLYRELFDVRTNDTIIAAVPLAHSFGVVGGLWLALRTGARLIHRSATPPVGLLDAIVAHRPRVVLGAPLVYDLCVRCAAQTPPKLNAGVLLSSGSPLPDETSERFERLFGMRVVSLYGSTETGLIATARSSDQVAPGRVGLPAPGVDVRLRADDGSIVTSGPATLEVRTRTMFTGYLDDAAATNRVLVDGWYRIGDLASIGEDGSLTLHGRSTAFVNVAGRKVNPAEVADVLKKHPSVTAARVYGRDAGAVGQHLIAEVVLDEEVVTSVLSDWCRNRLPAYMTPVEFIRVSEISPQSRKLMA